MEASGSQLPVASNPCGRARHGSRLVPTFRDSGYRQRNDREDKRGHGVVRAGHRGDRLGACEQLHAEAARAGERLRPLPTKHRL